MKKIAYKGFNLNNKNELVCRDMIFKVGEIAEVNGELKLCANGIHFCWNPNDINDYYNLRKSVIAEVEILGDIVNQSDLKKSCTNKLRVVRVLTKEQVWAISNTGSENSGYINSGFFNTIENKCFIFDKLSDMTVKEFFNSEFYKALISAPFILTEWVYYTDEEKQNDKAKELIEGYLKHYDYKEACSKWWNAMVDENKAIVRKIPNFDADKFYEITGIRL